MLPSRVFRGPFARRGLAPRMLSRTVEDTGTVTSPLVPWNSCGAYMTGVLGVSDGAVPAVGLLQLINPLIAVGYALTGFRVEHARRPGDVDGRTRAGPTADRNRP